MASTAAPVLGAAPLGKRQLANTIPATEFAMPYKSTFTSLKTSAHLVKNQLAYVNCSYLSSKAHAPTLLDLKRHAQALTNLIRAHTISTNSGLVDNADFQENESFDFLNDLSRVYANDDAAHNVPLTSLQNILEVNNNVVKDICPLTKVGEGAPTNTLPWASKNTLVKHADEVLTLLDHSLQSSGGLLSAIPLEEEEPEKEAYELSQRTVLGQWISFTRKLVFRIHDLEAAYGTCLDTLAGEASVPHEWIDAQSMTKRMGVKFEDEWKIPQDKYILVSGDDAWPEISRKLDNQMKATLGDKKGMVWIDLTTRYGKLRGGRTIFVRPGGHEKYKNGEPPSVVQVVKPEWPVRASVWETERRAELEKARTVGLENAMLKAKIEALEADITVLKGDDRMQLDRDRFFKNLTNQDEMRKQMMERAREELAAEWTELNEERSKLENFKSALTEAVNKETAKQARENREAYERDLRNIKAHYAVELKSFVDKEFLKRVDAEVDKKVEQRLLVILDGANKEGSELKKGDM